MLLRDADLWQIVADDDKFVQRWNPDSESYEPGLVPDAQQYTSHSVVQASSLDLTVGLIFVPETPSGDLGSTERPRRDGFFLPPGKTVIVRTAERLQMPDDLAGFGFPPARVSREGVLMTNPGHIDPGFVGHLTLTIINMGTESYQLLPGHQILSLLLFRLAAPPERSWRQRSGNTAGGVVRQTTLDRLSADFLDVEQRAREVADNVERRAQRAGRWWAALAAVIGVIVPIIATILTERFSGLGRVEDRVQAIESDIDGFEFDQRLAEVEERLQRLSSTGEEPSEPDGG